MDAKSSEAMTAHEFRAFLDLLMVSDPWPLTNNEHAMLTDFADRVSVLHGYENWIAAYHEMEKP